MLRQRLEDLARIREPSARSELVRLIGAQYAESGTHEPTPVERNLFSALVLDIFDQLDHAARMDIVVRLAKTARITTALADRLAKEPFELCEPVLQHSPVISLETLLEVARNRTDRHRLAIARRASLPSRLVEPLVARGSFAVVNAALHNPGADFSVRAMLALLIIANSDPRLLGAMAKRCREDGQFHDDVTLIAESNCPLLPPVLGQALADDGALAQLAGRAVADARDTGLEVGGKLLTKHELCIQIVSGELSFENILLTLVERGDIDGLVWLVARHLRLREASVRDTFRSDADGAVAMLMKETGIGPYAFAAFLKLRYRWLGRNPNGIPDEVLRYRALRGARKRSRLN